MKVTVRDSQTLELIQPEALGKYLAAREWSNLRPFGEFGTIYKRTKGARKYELLVPLTREIEDFPERVFDILRTLEVVEERSQIEILSDLTSILADVVRIRRSEAVDGTLPLEDGASLFTSAFEMVKAAACTAVDPRFYYQGNKPSQVTEYLRKARLGQSERGSYVLTVISPLPPPAEQAALFGMQDPFERKVTRLIADGLEATVEASEYALRTAKTDHFRESMRDGISANLLDAAVGLMGISYRSVGVNFAWSPELPIDKDPSRTIILESDYVPVIQEASKLLKLQAPQPKVQITGAVIGLHRDQGAEMGRTKLLAFVNGKTRIVNLELSSEFYDLAITAHREERPVICEGELGKIGRATVLTKVTSFNVAPSFDEDEGPDEPIFSP